MDWGEIIMNALWGLVGSIIGVIGTLGVGIWSDRKGYNKISSKVGELNNTTLSGQHNEISGLIRNVKEDVKNTITDRAKFTDRYSMEINSKVDQIAKIIDKNEVRYENLNLDQREVRNNVTKLVNSWEMLIKDNKELKELVVDLRKENEKLKTLIQNKNYQKQNYYDRERDLER